MRNEILKIDESTKYVRYHLSTFYVYNWFHSVNELSIFINVR